MAWKCEVCGYVHEGPAPPPVCPICNAGAEMFSPLDAGGGAPAASPGAADRIVVLGAGIAGVTAADHARRASASAAVSLVSNEPGPPYLRLNLTRFLAGEVVEGDLPMHDDAWYRDRRIDLVSGEAAAIDRTGRVVLLADGRSLPYDRLVLAAGARPFLPPIPGAEGLLVRTLRTLADAREILRAAAGARCVCVGGGLLGLETAGALARRGARVAVLEAAPWLLPRQFAEPGGRLVEARLHALGVEVRCGARIEAFERAEGGAVRLAGGERLGADLVVVAAGIRPRSDLAVACGLPVRSGVVVDDRMATADPAIFAAGDVAEHAGIVYGIWPAGYAQGAAAGTNAAGGAAAFHGLAPSTRLKVLGLDAFSVGRFEPEGPADTVVERAAEGAYLRFLVRGGLLIGANLVGDASLSAAAKEAVEKGLPPPPLG